MKTTASVFGLATMVMAVTIATTTSLMGCSQAPDPSGSSYTSGSRSKTPASSGGGGDTTTNNNNNNNNGGGDDETTPATPTTPTTDPTSTTPTGDPPPTTPAPDPFCDENKTIPGTKLLDDPLAVEKGFFTVGEGFRQASWAFDGTALRQTELIDAVDNLVFNKDAAITDVQIEVRASSTEVSSEITPRLRQMFILVGSTITNGQLSAVGCGVEVVQGQTVEQKTSVVRFMGAPNAVTTTPIERVNRAALQANEEFGMKARLSKGTLTCEVKQAATTTATATNLGTVTGSVGFFTRQTKALFKNAKICKLK